MSTTTTRPYVTPLVARLARDAGVDTSTLTGTGVGGRIRAGDVQAAAAHRAPSAPDDGWFPQFPIAEHDDGAPIPAPARAATAAPASGADGWFPEFPVPRNLGEA